MIERRISGQAVAEYACAEPGAVPTGGTEGERRGGELHFAVRSIGDGTQVNLDGLAERISGMAIPSFA
jgi:hypothetical protein